MTREKQIAQCFEIMEYLQNTWNPFGFFSSANDLSKFPKDVVEEARILWIRKRIPDVYESVNSLCLNLIHASNNVIPGKDWTKIMSVVGCGIGYSAVKHDSKYSKKAKIFIPDICKEVFRNYFEDADEAFDRMLDFIDLTKETTVCSNPELLMATILRKISTKISDTNITEDLAIKLALTLRKEISKTSFGL